MSEERIIAKLMEHDEKFEEVDSKLDKFREEVLSGQDHMMTVLKRLDEERVFTHKWVKDIENKVEENTLEIKKLKLQLNIV